MRLPVLILAGLVASAAAFAQQPPPTITPSYGGRVIVVPAPGLVPFPSATGFPTATVATPSTTLNLARPNAAVQPPSPGDPDSATSSCPQAAVIPHARFICPHP